MTVPDIEKEQGKTEAYKSTSNPTHNATKMKAGSDREDSELSESLSPTLRQAEGTGMSSQQEHRTVVLRNLPESADYTVVQSLIYGGQIQTMVLNRQKRAAYVTFTSAADCKGFIDSCSDNQVIFKLQRKTYTADIQLSKKTDPYDARLQTMLDCGATRVVVAENVLDEMPMRELEQRARGPSFVREIEVIYASYRGGQHTVIIRFTNIQDAISFKAMLSKVAELKAGLRFGEDPCANATGPHHE